MKIVQLVYVLGPGGAEKFVVNLSNALADIGHEVEICMIRNDDDVEPIFFSCQFISDKVKYTNLGLSKGFAINKVMKVSRYISSVKPDVVHCHLNVIPYIYPLVFLNNDIHFFHTIHNVADKAAGVKAQYLIDRWLYKSNRIIPVTISNECLKSFQDYYSLKGIYMIENGCKLSSDSTEKNRVADEIRSYKHRTETPVFIHVARFERQKNQGLLIESFNDLYDNGIDFTLIVLGANYDSPEGIKLQQRACGNIHFLGIKSNVYDYLVNSDYFVLTSLWEGLPISLIEAMSVGCIPICTPAGGIPDVIDDRSNGYLAESFDKNSFIDAVKEALNTDIDRNDIIESCHCRFSIENCAEAYSELFMSIE